MLSCVLWSGACVPKHQLVVSVRAPYRAPNAWCAGLRWGLRAEMACVPRGVLAVLVAFPYVSRQRGAGVANCDL
jgi:hypothetical protein